MEQFLEVLSIIATLLFTVCVAGVVYGVLSLRGEDFSRPHDDTDQL